MPIFMTNFFLCIELSVHPGTSPRSASKSKLHDFGNALKILRSSTASDFEGHPVVKYATANFGSTKLLWIDLRYATHEDYKCSLSCMFAGRTVCYAHKLCQCLFENLQHCETPKM